MFTARRPFVAFRRARKYLKVRKLLLRDFSNLRFFCVMIGLQIDSMPINIEPGLFEWLGWYPEIMPDWLTHKEIQEAGFRINPDYKCIISIEELLASRESCEEYYIRSFYLTQSVIKETADKGKNSSVLLFFHCSLNYLFDFHPTIVAIFTSYDHL